MIRSLRTLRRAGRFVLSSRCMQRGTIQQPHSQLPRGIMGFRHRASALAMEAKQVGKVHLRIRLELNHQQALDALSGKLSQRTGRGLDAGPKPQALHSQLPDALHPRLQYVVAEYRHPRGIRCPRIFERCQPMRLNFTDPCELVPARNHHECSQFHVVTPFSKSPHRNG